MPVSRSRIVSAPGHAGGEQAVLEEARGHRMIHALLVALFKTSGLQHAVKVASLECRQVEVHLGMIPKVRLRFLDE